jgi:hypothetical protein
VREGKKDKDILDLLRTMPQGRMDSWLTLSALKRSKALHRANPNTTVIFGGKHNLQLRSQGKITAEEWKAKRLLPVYFEGHAKSHGEQGGNHRFVLDIEHNTVWFYPKVKVALPLQIKLGKKSNYRELLDALQFRCTRPRDVPFTVSLTATHISISWDEKMEPLNRKTHPATGPPAGGRRPSAHGSEPGLQFQTGQPALGLALIDPRPGLRGRGVGQTISSRRPEKLRAHEWRKPTEGRTPSAGTAKCRGSRGVETGLESTSPKIF